MNLHHIRENTCYICLEEVYPAGTELVNPAIPVPNTLLLNCGHILHHTCLQQCRNYPPLARRCHQCFLCFAPVSVITHPPLHASRESPRGVLEPLPASRLMESYRSAYEDAPYIASLALTYIFCTTFTIHAYPIMNSRYPSNITATEPMNELVVALGNKIFVLFVSVGVGVYLGSALGWSSQIVTRTRPARMIVGSITAVLDVAMHALSRCVTERNRR